MSSSRVVHARAEDSPCPPCTLIYLTRSRTRAREISLQVTTLPSVSERPSVLPRRRKLWKLARLAVSWREESGDTGEHPKEKDIVKKLPPPSHFSALLPSPPRPGSMHWIRPKRIVVGGKDTADRVVPPSGTQNGIAASDIQEPSANSNGHINPDKAQCNASGFPQRPSTK